MPERKISRRGLLRATGLILGGVALAGCAGETSPTEPAPTKVAKPNPFKPTSTSLPTTALTVTPEPTIILKELEERVAREKGAGIPQIAGLKLVQEGEKWVYKNEKGEYAGEIIEYIFNGERTTGVVLESSAMKPLIKEKNTPEAIAAGKWIIPFPLDARGEKNLVIKTWRSGVLDYIEFILEGLSLNAKFVSPFTDNAEWSPTGNCPGIGPCPGVKVPKSLTGSSSYEIGIAHSNQPVSIRGGGYVGFGEPLLWGISGQLGPRAPRGSQIDLFVGPAPGGGNDMNITDNILTTKTPSGKEVMIFLGANAESAK